MEFLHVGKPAESVLLFLCVATALAPFTLSTCGARFGLGAGSSLLRWTKGHLTPALDRPFLFKTQQTKDTSSRNSCHLDSYLSCN